MTEKELKKKAQAEEMARLLKSHGTLLERVDKEGTVKAEFTCIDDPKGTFDLTYPAVPGGKTYHLRSGLSYDLPPSMIDHLNSLKVPDPQTEEDPVTRQIRPVLDENGQVPKKRRFSVIPLKMNMAGNRASEEKAA